MSVLADRADRIAAETCRSASAIPDALPETGGDASDWIAVIPTDNAPVFFDFPVNPFGRRGRDPRV